MPYLSKAQIAAAREMDLLTYLRQSEPEELVHIGGGTYATRTHDSLKISNGKWCWWSRNIGGTNALDYLTKVKGVPFLDAVQCILGDLPKVQPTPRPVVPPKTEFVLPPKHADNRRVFRICEVVALTRRSSTTASSVGSFTRTQSIIIAYLWATETTSLPMARCGGHFQTAPLPVKFPAAINGFPLPCLAVPVVKRSACLKRPLTHSLI